ncbi:MAG: ATP synthase F1 subunit gamma [Candidatus Falkowbacteria bacterium]|nr:ATP synthase F1 subunit gamma [Candidatus Falkowbacteria bacterium]
MANTKDIQRRIKSVANTKKITRAMEMVAAAKMRKAVEGTLATRTYANLSWETLLNLTQGAAHVATHPLLVSRKEIKRQAIVAITSNRGLCGGFNASIVSAVRELAADKNVITDVILVGKKGESLGDTCEIVAQFPYPETGLSAAAVSPIISFVSNGFLTGQYDRVFVAYTDFINAVKQIPRVRQILPVMTDTADNNLGIIQTEDHIGLSKEMAKDKSAKHSHRSGFSFEYVFEPAPEIVLQAVVPRLLEVQLYQALLESVASEHSARMSAMHQATQAASDLGTELTLFYNKARQAAITGEIAEITAGVAALE